MQFMTPDIIKNSHQESNLTAPYTEEDKQHSLEKMKIFR
jgi:hypothetical protein